MSSSRVCFENIEVGQETGAVSLAITLQRLVMEAGANRDFAPSHHDTAYAQARQARGPFANPFFLNGLAERTLREWMGLEGRLRKLSLRMHEYNVIGDVVTCSGRVVKTWVQDQENLVELEMQYQTSHGLTATAQAVISIQSSSE